MPSAVWSGHLHFGLVAMPVRLLVAARTKTTRFRRLYRKPVNENPILSSFPSFTHDIEEHDSEMALGVAETRPIPEEMNGRNTAQHQYSAVRQVLQSDETGEELRPNEMVKGYEIAPNEFAAIHPQEIKAAEIETSDTIDLFHFVKETKFIRFTLSGLIMSLPTLVQKRPTHCCSKRCEKRSASELPESGCTAGSTC